jgi:hypothetical protein
MIHAKVTGGRSRIVTSRHVGLRQVPFMVLFRGLIGKTGDNAENISELAYHLRCNPDISQIKISVVK